MQKTKWKRDVQEQLEQLEIRKQAAKEEELNERLWVYSGIKIISYLN